MVTTLLTNNETDLTDTWNLNDLTTNPEELLKTVVQKSHDFVSQAKPWVEQVNTTLQATSDTAKKLYNYICAYEELLETAGKLISYASLAYHADLKDQAIGSFYQKSQEAYTEMQQQLVFFDLFITHMPTEIWENLLNLCVPLNTYSSWVNRTQRYKKYLLVEREEQLLLAKSLPANQAWVRLYDETLAGLSFVFEGQTVPLEVVISGMGAADADKRCKAAQSLYNGLSSQVDLFTRITNVLVKDKEQNDTWRGYENPQASRHLANEVSNEAVEALSATVIKNYPNLSHRYYQLKAKFMGVDRLNYWDRNAPLSHTDDIHINYSDAKKLVFDAYQGFSPTLANGVKQFFDQRWIDVYPREGKASGAFCHPTVPSCHPYILLNYQHKRRDVMTLAHELGHGVHDLLSREYGYLCSDIPLTLAETASVFGEMITFQHLLKACHNPEEKRNMLAGKIEDMLNTVVRQIAFYQFEVHVHNARKKRELSSDDLAQFWRLTQEEALGDAVILNDTCSNYWAYISHFIHSPFYVYAYAFGDCLVNSLFSVYQETPEGFEPKYLDMLRAGGTKSYTELLKPFGLDATRGDFWQLGLDVINSYIDQFEATL